MLHRLVRRIAYKYFVSDFNVASLELLLGTFLVIAGACELIAAALLVVKRRPQNQ